MTPQSRSASTRWASFTTSGAVLALMLAGGCGPSLSQLLQDRHYDDAICAAALDGTGMSTRRVGRALAQDLKSAIHLYPITTDELRSALAGKLNQDVERLQQQFLFVRLQYSANQVPVGSFGLAVRTQTDRSRLRIVDFSQYETIVALTHERIPTPRTGTTTNHALLANILASPLLLMANLFSIPFAGKAVYFRSRTRQVTLDLTESDWLAAAPDAHALRQLFHPTECVDAMTRPCQAFLAIERPGTTAEAESYPPVQLQFVLSFGPLPIYQNEAAGPACFLELTHTLELPPGAPLAARLTGLFGTQQRLFSELGTPLSAYAELLRSER